MRYLTLIKEALYYGEMNALDKACQIAESQARLARKLDIKPQALFGWMKSGLVPADRVISVSRAVEFEVTPHQLRPDLYPHPDDGLPPALRGKVEASPQPNLQGAS